ncbi:hypothetical protein IZU99_08005 [Oscillospiraceae bacterium CM]|nr:hypothetical protein IZU99_08005 [Oscillospiraceae bacterium CM]
MLISRTAGTTTLYYLYNGHGDVVNIADSTGSIVMTYDYDAFGVVTTATGNIANSYLYAGYQFDDETGMYYLNARYYDPVTARFITADSYTGQANDPLSLNLYTYCHNEPMMNSDPTGHVDEPSYFYSTSSRYLGSIPGSGVSEPEITTTTIYYSNGGIKSVETVHEICGNITETTKEITPDGRETKHVVIYDNNGKIIYDSDNGQKGTNIFTPSKANTTIKPIEYGTINTSYDSDNDVMQMQWLLYMLGYYTGIYTADDFNQGRVVDGVFQKNTLEALLRFQTLYITKGVITKSDLFNSDGSYAGCGKFIAGELSKIYADYLTNPSSYAKYKGQRNDLVNSIMDSMTITPSSAIIDNNTGGSGGATENTSEYLVTKELLEQLLKKSNHFLAGKVTDALVSDLNRVLVTYGITTLEQVQYFLAVCLHESRLALTEAGWCSESYVRQYCKKYEPGTTGGKNLGNTQVGDGYLFRGAGFIQLTGRYNYQKFSNYLIEKFGISDPNIMKLGANHIAANYAWEVAGYYWSTHKINDVIAKGYDSMTTLKMVSNAVYAGDSNASAYPGEWDSRKEIYTVVTSIIK